MAPACSNPGPSVVLRSISQAPCCVCRPRSSQRNVAWRERRHPKGLGHAAGGVSCPCPRRPIGDWALQRLPRLKQGSCRAGRRWARPGRAQPLLTKAFLAGARLSVTRLSAEPAWGCKQLGLALLSQRESKIKTKCSRSAVRRGAATLRPAPPWEQKPGPVAPGRVQHTGMGPGAGLLAAP